MGQLAPCKIPASNSLSEKDSMPKTLSRRSRIAWQRRNVGTCFRSNPPPGAREVAVEGRPNQKVRRAPTWMILLMFADEITPTPRVPMLEFGKPKSGLLSISSASARI